MLNNPTQLVIEETQLERLKASPQRATSSGMRRKKALARLDFYDLVAVGGKVFIIMSLPFLLVGVLLRGLEVYHAIVANKATATLAKEWRLQ